MFIPVSERKQPAFVPRTAKDRQARGEGAATRESHRDGDRGKPRGRRIDLAVVAREIRSHIADDRRWIAPRGIDERVELQRRHRREHRVAKLFAILTTGPTTRTVVAGVVGRLRALEPPANRRVKVTALDDLVERLDGRTGFRQVVFKIVLETAARPGTLGSLRLSIDRSGIHDLCARSFQFCQR